MAETTPESVEEAVDLRGLKCPLPALLARRALARAPAGTALTVLADDPLAAVGIPHMCHREGFAVVAVVRCGAEARLTIRKPAPSVARSLPQS